METRIIYIGDTNMIDYPFILNREEDWLIPNGWYLLQNEMENRPAVVYTKNREPIIVIEHIQINYNVDNNEYRLSVIKTDKKMEIDDVIVYK